MNHKEKEPTVKIVGKELEELNGRLKSQVMARVVEKYGKDYYIPGLEYAKYLLELEKENPGKIFQTIPQTMGRYYLMGSMIRGKDGRMSVFCLSWSGQKLSLSRVWLGERWFGDDHVVLLEK